MKRDHGYAWFILVTSFLNNMIMCAVLVSPTLFLVDFAEAFHIDTQQAGWLCSVNCFANCISSTFVGILIDKYGCSKVGFLSSLLMGVFLAISSVIQNVWLFAFTYSILAGACLGGTALPPIVIIQQYFDKKRPFATAFTLIGNSIGILGLLPLFGWLIDTFGWRGALLIIAGVSFHICALSLTYTPFREQLNSDKLENNNSNRNHRDDAKQQYKSQKPSLPLLDIATSKLFITMVISYGFFQLGADFIFRLTVPRAQLDLGCSEVKSSFIVSSVSCGALFSRFFTSFITIFKEVNITAMYAVSITIGGATAIWTVFTKTYLGVLLTSALYGLSYGIVTSLSTTVLVQLMEVQNIAKSQGLMSSSVGIVFLLGAPFAGYMYETFGSFNIAFVIAGAVQMLGGLVALILVFSDCRKVRYSKCCCSNSDEKSALINSRTQDYHSTDKTK